MLGVGGGGQVSHVIIINEKQFLIQYLVPIKLLISKQYVGNTNTTSGFVTGQILN